MNHLGLPLAIALTLAILMGASRSHAEIWIAQAFRLEVVTVGAQGTTLRSLRWWLCPTS